MKLRQYFGSELSDVIAAIVVASAIVLQGSYFPVQYLGVFICVLCIIYVRIVKRKGLFLHPPGFIILAGLFGLAYMLSVIFSAADKYIAMVETFKILCFILLILLSMLVEQKKYILKGIFWGCLAVSIIGLLGYTDLVSFPGIILFDGKNARLQSVIQYANVTALFMAMGFFISINEWAAENRMKRKREYFLYSFVFLLSLFLTLSRMTLVMTAILLFLWLILQKSIKSAAVVFIELLAAIPTAYYLNIFVQQKRYGVLSVTLAAVIVFMAWGYPYVEKILHGRNLKFCFIVPGMLAAALGIVSIGLKDFRIFKLSLYDGTLMERIIYMKDAYAAVWENPFFGIGPGNWAGQQFMYQTAQYFTRYIHNGFMQIALDAGVIGLALFILLIGFFYAGAIGYLKKGADSHILTVFSITTLLLVHSLLDAGLSFGSVLFVLGWLLPSIFKDNAPKSIRCPDGYGKVVVHLAVLLLLAAGIYFISGQLLFENAKATFAENNAGRSAELFKISALFRPLDGEVYFGLAEAYEKMGQPGGTVLECLHRAHVYNKFEPRYLQKSVKVLEQMGDPRTALEVSIELIRVNPLSIDNYKAARNILDRMYAEKLINARDYDGEIQYLEESLSAARLKVSSLSKYLNHQIPLYH